MVSDCWSVKMYISHQTERRYISSNRMSVEKNMLVGISLVRLTIRRYRCVRRYKFIPTPLTASERVSRHNFVATDSSLLQRVIPTARKSL